MQELICPECKHRNPDIRELGYTLPWTCGNCPHVWRLQDLGPLPPMTKEDAKAFLVNGGFVREDGSLTEQYGGEPLTPNLRVLDERSV